MEKIKKVEDIFAKVQRIFFCAVLAFMAVVMFAAVVYRYCLKDPIIWSEELTTLLQGMLAFAGIGYCFRYKAHTRVLLFHDKFPKFIQGIIDLICDAIMVFCLFKFCETMPKYIASKSASLTTISWLNTNVFNYVIYIGFIFGIVYILIDASKTIYQMMHPELAEKNQNNLEKEVK